MFVRCPRCGSEATVIVTVPVNVMVLEVEDAHVTLTSRGQLAGQNIRVPWGTPARCVARGCGWEGPVLEELRDDQPSPRRPTPAPVLQFGGRRTLCLAHGEDDHVACLRDMGHEPPHRYSPDLDGAAIEWED
jgi:hypothetical protein